MTAVDGRTFAATVISRARATPRAITALSTVLLAGLCIGCASGSHAAHGRSATSLTTHLHTTPATRQRRRSVASRGWLGLNFNSGTGAKEYPNGSGPGELRQFAAQGLVWDRLGDLEIYAGSTIANFPSLRLGLRVSVGAGMVPDVLIDPLEAAKGCTTDPEPAKLCLPVTSAQIRAFVSGFIATATSILTAYPHDGVVFEPMNEPWDWPFPPGAASGRSAAQQYANLLKSLLPAARRAGIPLSSIYVPATGTLDDDSSWISDLYAAQPCLLPGRGTCGPIEGWNAHPYGLPGSSFSGIDSVPTERAEMKSGQNNIIASEMGFCSSDVDSGEYCDLNLSQVDGTSTQTDQWLAETLNAAAQMHRAGWLRALIIWARSFGGWSMQTATGQLTPQGRVLASFAAHQPHSG